MSGFSVRPVPSGGGFAASRQEAFELARVKLAGLCPEETAGRTGARPRPQGVTIDFLGGTYDVDFEQGTVGLLSGPDSGSSGTDHLTVSTLILHYLLTASGAPLTGVWASYREFPGAQIYYGPFRARTVLPLVRVYGPRPGDLLGAASRVGGRPAALGDAGAVIDVLPRLPVTFAVWAGDDEVPASASVLFDSTASGYLPLEDLVVAASLAAVALCRAAPPATRPAVTGGR